MILADAPDWAKHALCVTEALRRLGFAADDIYFYTATEAEDKKKWFFVALHLDGEDKPASFAYAVIPVEETKLDEDGVGRLFERVLPLWNSAPEQDALRLFQEQRYYDDVELVAGLVTKGLYPRPIAN